MFCNGSDYEAFLDRNCYKCSFFVDYDEATKEKPMCPIEERIALASLGLEEGFPYEWLDKNKSMPTYSCRKFKGKEKLTEEDLAVQT